MELFHEIYGTYYLIYHHLLTAAAKGPLTKSQVEACIKAYGYEESTLHLSPKLSPKSTDGYPLLKEDMRSGLNSAPPTYLTLAEKRFLKALLKDPRLGLFLKEEARLELEGFLEDIEPLFDPQDYCYKGVSNDGDDYSDSRYQHLFRQVLLALRKGCPLLVRFKNAEDEERFGLYAPHRLEYSIKDDKFRLNAVLLKKEKATDTYALRMYHRLNLSRIVHIRCLTEETLPPDLESFIAKHRCAEPIVIQCLNMRNSFERTFIQLSGYDRQTDFDPETKISTIRLFYYDFEEPELLITLLSFGPTVRVLSPPHFRQKLKERILGQLELNSPSPSEYPV